MRCPFVFAVLLAPLLLASSAKADVRGSWNAHLDRQQLALDLSFEKHNQIHETLPLEGWAGLDSARAPKAHLTLKREAGTLTLDGHFEQDEGGGGFTFAADPGFTQQLRQSGDAPTDQEMLLLFMFNLGPRYLAEMARLGYPNLSLKELEEAGVFHLQPEWVRALADAGFRGLPFEDLVRSRVFHLGPEKLAEYRAAIPGLTFDDAVRLATMKVDAAFVQQLAAAGYPHLDPDALLRLKMFHVTPEVLRAFAQLGYRGLDPDTLVSWGMQRVTPEYVKALASHGYTRLSPDQLVSLRMHGVTPEFISGLEARGQKPADAEGLLRLRLHADAP